MMRSWLFIAVLLVSGCAHTNDFESSMNSRVGRLTYDDAIQTWGPPANVAEGDRVIVAAWSKSRGTDTVFTPGIGLAHSSARSSDLTVTFDKETKRMIAWSLE